MTKHILITREVGKDSPFQRLSELDTSLIATSFLTFKAIKPSYIPITQWYYFYSRTGVNMAANHHILSSRINKAKIGVFGPATAVYFEQVFGKSPDLVGNGKIGEHIDLVREVITTQTMTFVQGTASRRSIQRQLTPDLSVEEVHLYSSEYNSIALKTQPDIILFTSPLNADSYYSQYDYSDKQHIISIGKTTHDHLVDRFGISSAYPNEPTEQGMLDLLLPLL